MIQKPPNDIHNSNNPLVSIIIVTYNSGKFILETLESAKTQSYKNVELIISDDCSSDNTIKICEEWIKANRAYFINCIIVTTPVNTGIPANCNRGLNAAQGVWIKILAGDDMFYQDCIQSNIDYTSQNNNIKFLFSKVDFLINEPAIKYGQDIPLIDLEFYNATPKYQHELLVEGSKKAYVPAATGFLNKQTLIDLSGFDEEIQLCEDYPMWMKATKNNIKLYFMDKKTVWYRVHEESIMGSRSLRYEQSMKKVFFKYRFKFLLRKRPFFAIDLFFRNISRTSLFWSRTTNLLLPSTYISWLKIKLK
ncbi:glycosyltransferase family 2 protein [Mariniflexile sp. AS56]|uniref:glycosyltransferase family 2 protein n=1 Tax=Mariniflexile sp. AS56 TaxID=3063957 RepID=UPI0026EF5DDD|nr:glycosyltransferase [Mariniflexile sp. AS56]MDO7171368.1 glycosyltransferase [Mariniflexile sp. AS56]